MNQRLLAVVTVSALALAALLVLVSCASKHDEPGTATATAVAGSSTQTTTQASSSAAASDAYIMFHDDHNDLVVRDFATGKSYTHAPVDATTEVIVQTKCSDDGSRIAYLDDVFADTTHRRIIIRGSNAPAGPLVVSSLTQWIAWSPDGNQLATVIWDGHNKKATVAIYNVNSQVSTTIMQGDQYVGNIAWSPVGDRLAFYLENSGNTSSDIYIMDTTGANLRQLTHGNGDLTWLDPSWSPDGTSLIAAGAESNSVQLYRIDPNTGETTPRTTNPDIYKRNPFYSPDGTIVAYTGSVVLQGVSVSALALHQFAIFTMDPDGSNDRALTADPRGTTPGPNDPFLNAYMLGWCASGPWLDDLWAETMP